jgi:hypothetical protein
VTLVYALTLRVGIISISFDGSRGDAETQRRGSIKKANHCNLCVFASLWLKLLIIANKHSLDSLAYASGWDNFDQIRWFTRRRGDAEKRCDPEMNS